ncbi:uncharacterized protein LOC113147476 [Cyclospora cayetanensis]|uniref:Uncharacterized protein LOC113147476 n=1 Tax=Cyclospora cayetanensis TaxID=88456 RepID=A0A6P6S2R0_9EIME|nr:uncharacterized protein LOC113147476 [Cyclospora cayetanensis]
MFNLHVCPRAHSLPNKPVAGITAMPDRRMPSNRIQKLKIAFFVRRTPTELNGQVGGSRVTWGPTPDALWCHSSFGLAHHPTENFLILSSYLSAVIFICCSCRWILFFRPGFPRETHRRLLDTQAKADAALRTVKQQLIPEVLFLSTRSYEHQEPPESPLGSPAWELWMNFPLALTNTPESSPRSSTLAAPPSAAAAAAAATLTCTGRAWAAFPAAAVEEERLNPLAGFAISAAAMVTQVPSESEGRTNAMDVVSRLAKSFVAAGDVLGQHEILNGCETSARASAAAVADAPTEIPLVTQQQHEQQGQQSPESDPQDVQQQNAVISGIWHVRGTSELRSHSLETQESDFLKERGAQVGAALCSALPTPSWGICWLEGRRIALQSAQNALGEPPCREGQGVTSTVGPALSVLAAAVHLCGCRDTVAIERAQRLVKARQHGGNALAPVGVAALVAASAATRLLLFESLYDLRRGANQKFSLLDRTASMFYDSIPSLTRVPRAYTDSLRCRAWGSKLLTYIVQCLRHKYYAML